MSNPSTPSSNQATSPALPTAAQLAEARLRRWHQQGEALLTIENLRSWLNSAGLVLFAPRPQIVAPAPSLVEAVLGAPNASPTIEQTAEARGLLARLVAEGLAVPLNLLGAGIATVHPGAPGDTPDFVASAAVFSYIFTLRGDKAWKQPPAATGAFKVSPLALASFEALTLRGPSSAYDLATQVGKEVTEAAVLRSLAELWTHLRVLPIAQPDGAPTLWELASARFTKQIKAGANAGQPSALSALISLYLGQAIVASEDEIESFLSPLAARSRIRDVIHALLSARQIDTVAVQGRTLLYIAGEMPAFLAPQQTLIESGSQAATAVDEIAAEAATATGPEGEAAPRIAKFVPKPRKIGTGYLAKAKPAQSRPNQPRPAQSRPDQPRAKPFARRPFAAAQPPASDSAAKPAFKPSFKPRPGGSFKPRTSSAPAPNRERRPFSKPPASRFGKTSAFDKPWDEEKARRRAAAAKPSDLPPETQQPSTDLPASATSASHTQSPRPYTPRGQGQTGDGRPPRKTFSKPGTFTRKRTGFAARPAFGGDARPPRKPFGSRPAGEPERGGKPRFAKSPGFAKSSDFSNSNPKARSAGKPSDGGSRDFPSGSGKRVYRKFDAPRNRPDRPFSSVRPARAKDAGSDAAKPAGDFAPRNFAGKPASFAHKKPFGKSSGKPGSFAGKKPFAKSSGKSSSFPGKKPFAKSSGSGKPRASSTGKPASTFAKFAGNRKPFGKRPPARKFKPGKDRPA